MDTSQAEHLGKTVKAVRPRQTGALPLVYPVLTDLQVQSIANDLVPSQADVDMGRVVALLVLNRLLAPQPLYQIQDWLAETVLPEVLDVTPQQVYDNRLGRALDDSTRIWGISGLVWQPKRSGSTIWT
ncbi:MAG: DUF4277 domain-containing protein [Chloroflexi bacterium]|nr:DUF4277 domain-containing protein [Chloroflexota bacterium]